MNVFSKLSCSISKFSRYLVKPKSLRNSYINNGFLKRKLSIGTIVLFGFVTTTYFVKSSIKLSSCFTDNGSELNNVIENSVVESNSLLSNNLTLLLVYGDIVLFILAIAAAVVTAIMNIKIPLQLGNMVNALNKLQNGITETFFVTIRRPSLELFLSYCIQALSTTVYISLLSMIGERLAGRLRIKLFERLIVQDAAFYDRNKIGDLLHRITVDVQDFKSSFKLCISQGLRSTIQLIGSTVALIWISKELTGIVLITIPAIVIVGSAFGKVLRTMSRDAQIQNAKSVEIANETFTNIRTVKSFAMEDKEIEAFSLEVELSKSLYSVLGFGIGVFQGLSNLAINGIVLGVLFTGGYLMNTGNLSAGDLMSFLVASQTIQKSLATLSSLFSQILKASTAGNRLFEFLCLTHPSTSPDLSELHQLRFDKDYLKSNFLSSGSVEFRNVSFQYPARNETVLEHIDLHIKPGSIVAFCGESGAGKSTLSNLIQRMYDVTAGEILIDGISLKDMRVSHLRGEVIGVISQQPQLFATTIRENIRYGRFDATDEEIVEAAKQAQAHEFITNFSNGYDTLVGERGGEAVSGGQRQRIAIARALLKNPRILIMDEATSALDSKSEILVQKALNAVMKDRTVIIIAHRLSTIRNADTIVVMDKGRIVEIGTHKSLMEQRARYYDLVRRQENKKDEL